MHMWDGFGWGWTLFMGMPFLFLVAVVVLIVLLTRSTGPSTAGQERAGDGVASRDSAMAVLRERYARGEIDEDEFNRRRQVLQAPER